MKRLSTDSTLPSPLKVPKKEPMEPDGQSLRSSEIDHRRWLMQNVKDCLIWVGQGASKKDFGASKAILALKSPVFFDFFFELANNSVYNLPEVTSKAFEILMPFIYQLEKDISVHLISTSIALELLNAVFCLQINELKDPIIDYLAINLDMDSMFLAMKLTNQYKISRLEKACIGVLASEMQTWLNSEKFLNTPLPMLLELYKRERFCPEIEMFKALERYAAHNGLQRNAGGENSTLLMKILCEIHFLMIPPKILIDVLDVSKLLTNREKMIIALETNPDTDLLLPEIISAEEKKFSLFIVKIFKDMRELFPKLGEKLFNCRCGKKHNLRFLLWEHDFKIEEQLVELEMVLKMAGLPHNLEEISKSDISVVQRTIGRFLYIKNAYKDIFNSSYIGKYLV